MNAPTRLHVWAQRTANRWWDIRATLAGYCNARSHTGIPGQGAGGYLHWRCARQRGHLGYHRYRNYIWHTNARVQYQPQPVRRVPGIPTVDQPWRRHMVRTMRQQRTYNRWQRIQQRILATTRTPHPHTRTVTPRPPDYPT